MQTQYINEWLDIPELKIHQLLSIHDDEVHIEALPLDDKQICPCCDSDQAVIRKGSNGMRTVRHLSVFEKKTYLHVPTIRMFCSNCEAGFVWAYDFVGPKQRYSRLFRSHTVEQALGSTAAHGARIQQAPASTVQRMHNEAVPALCDALYKQVWEEAKETAELVLGVDDFAIKKGHTYNTGIHNLKGETMLDLLPGRKLEALRAYAQAHPEFLRLDPKAVVMDLAQAYHTWISECFPKAIRIADRFHVHGYVIESVQEVRKTVQPTLSPRAKTYLKANHRLLNPPAESLSEESAKKLDTMLNYSPLLRSMWEWKEAFTTWYDCSPNYTVAKLGFERWCTQGDQIDHAAVQSALKTMRNWQEEIVNYHQCRWTNATVEGRHNRIKAFQRRHYFTRNRSRYKAGILIECNRHRMLSY
ncbi:ISL3 family transposase [Cohnella sp. LGH]|nr:ISL3 family transposase [Cohnella sp. LGH]QTH46739.1 ISL3 family transposase [Cohnella sp. LGH]QTH46846.1 ISL3 family transposase [Cohnella sp. LGH]QTH46907.1 ISL3 family transposase [Cohnella sp. LGH]QTH46912.1 ISL3 family transposase [Cohnella sp. LGH]